MRKGDMNKTFSQVCVAFFFTFFFFEILKLEKPIGNFSSKVFNNILRQKRLRLKLYSEKKLCQKWDSNPRLQWRPETSYAASAQVFHLSLAP